MAGVRTGRGRSRWPEADIPSGVELRHLRYFATIAATGSFTRAAELLFIAQPTLSQQIRRLEALVGTQLLRRGPGGARLTPAGAVFLDITRDVLSLLDHGISQTRQVAGLGRPRLRVVVPATLPDSLAVAAASALWAAADAANVDVQCIDASLDADFSPIRQRRADAGLGWLTVSPETLALPLDGMSLGEFEPDVWVPVGYPAARHAAISVGELADMTVVHGPRRTEAGIYDAWTAVLRQAAPHFEFTDPPMEHSLPVTLAWAAAAGPATAVLTGPSVRVQPELVRQPEPRSTHDMVLAGLAGRPLTATAALVWNHAVPAVLQQVLFEAAESVVKAATDRQ